MELTIVGSGTLLPDDVHRSPGHLIEHGGAGILLDCGSGVLHGLARDGLDWRGIGQVVLTHFHTDHFGDLASLLWAWKHGVPEASRRSRVLLGPVGLVRVVDALAAAFGDFVHAPGGVLDLVELEPGGAWADATEGVTIRTHSARHTPEALAVRIDTEAGSVGYTGDTGPHPPLGRFFQGVDILISECAVPDGASANNHLSPMDVAELAVAAGPARLVLTHLYPSVERDGLPERIRALGYEGEVLIASDGLRLQV